MMKNFRTIPIAGWIFAVLFSLFAACGTAFAHDSVKLDPADTEETVVRKAAGVTPSPRQLEWQRYELTAFLHFGMNTFTNREWGTGTESESLFNPTALDARQWVAALKDAGFKEIIITAKHHDGFCLWPSKFTEHSVKNSPWKDGKGAVVREVADAAHEAGLKFGVYLSPWDRHEATYGTPAYNDYYKNQLRELLTNYGEISEVWMDGACGDNDPRCGKMPYDWDNIFALVRELQPNAVLSIYGPDVRWVGNEAGDARESEWSVLPKSAGGGDPDLGSREMLMAAAKRGETLVWSPAQTDTSIRPGWFYHKTEDYSVRPLDKLIQIYFGSVGGNSVLLLNIPPDKRGRIADVDVRRLKQFRRALDAIFKNNLAAGASASTATAAHGDVSTARNTVDGDQDTFWSTDDGVTAATIEYDLGAPKTFDVAMLQEHIATGQRIEEFFIDIWDGSNWKQIAGATTVGYKRLLRLPAATARKVRVRITKSRVSPTLAEFGLFYSGKEK